METRCGHAKPCFCLGYRASERRRAPLAGSMPPAPAERPPGVRQAGPRSSVAESENPHKIRLFTPSIRNRGAILHNDLRR
ncbi:hypothetical protein [Xenorhabdus griffiniae]|uniref:hypothetical protein n=1 Tax=Xenorhabdus griffiniae TaxID=351672 RepID=UPI00187EA547|nr:hypothetical protein [Xenorhabdus griffiniae]MBE8586359.1 hypothetical protein [Xenorhabdus griffiniae]